MKKDNYYTTFDVVKIIDIKMERLQDWLKKGYIQPTDQEKVGRGIKKYFDRLGLYIIMAFKYLVENGITRDEAKQWTQGIRQVIQQDLDCFNKKNAQGKMFYKDLSKIPNFIVFFKGGSMFDSETPMPKDMMFTVKDEVEDITLDASMNADAIHIINFKKIKKQVDARLEE